MTKSSPDILVAGEALIDLLPVDDAAAMEPGLFRRRAGGAPANVAVALSRFDATPYLWTSIGDDAFGEHLKSVMSSASIPSQFVQERKNDSTGLTIVDDTVEGGFELYLDGTATVNFDIDDLPTAVFAEIKWVHLGGVLLACEPSRTAMFDLIDRAKEFDCTISFDPNTRPSIWSSTDECVETLEQVLTSVDVVVGHSDDFPNEGFPGDSTALAEAVLTRGADIVAITKGGAGAEVKTRIDSPWGDYHLSHPGFDVAVEDPTGAGDTFTAAFIRGLRREDITVAEALELANASGALATTRRGAIAAIPDRESVRAWIQQHSRSTD